MEMWFPAQQSHDSAWNLCIVSHELLIRPVTCKVTGGPSRRIPFRRYHPLNFFVKRTTILDLLFLDPERWSRTTILDLLLFLLQCTTPLNFSLNCNCITTLKNITTKTQFQRELLQNCYLFNSCNTVTTESFITCIIATFCWSNHPNTNKSFFIFIKILVTIWIETSVENA